MLGLIAAGVVIKNADSHLDEGNQVMSGGDGPLIDFAAHSAVRPSAGPFRSGGELAAGHPGLPEAETIISGFSGDQVIWEPAPLPMWADQGRQELIVVRRGDTLMDILLRAGVGRAEAHEAVSTLQEVYDPRRLRIGQMLNIEFRGLATADESFSGLSINLDFRNEIKLAKGDDGQFGVEQVERELIQESQFAQVRVDDSLFMAGKRAGVPDEALMEMIRLFSWDIDFQRDIQPGDSFELIYNTLNDPQGTQTQLEFVKYAKVNVGGDQLIAYRFVHDDGRVGYFDEQGQSLRKWLMRTPVDGARMSSGFGKRRHPILGYNKMHKGVDFAAPTGTPIYAAGDGTVVSLGRNGGYGNYIRIRHNGEYSTAYGHLSKYAKSLKKGDRVRQGEVIGYVGSTGRSTGPHLHYEVLQNGEQVNPLKIKPQKAAVLAGTELKAFQAMTQQVLASRGPSQAVAQR